MKNMQKFLSNTLAVCLEKRYIISSNEINKEDFEESLYTITRIKDVEYTGERFDLETVLILGIDNCCNFFKTVCHEYAAYKGVDNKVKSDLLTLNIAGKKYITNIKNYDIPLHIDEMLNSNFQELKKMDKGNTEDNILYEKVVINSFANFYYSIRDVLEGESYRDQYAVNREVPDYYIYGQDDLTLLANKNNITKDEMRVVLLEKLDKGIESVLKISYSKKEAEKEKQVKIKKRK